MINPTEVISLKRTEIMGYAMLFVILCHQPFFHSLPFEIFHFCGHFGVDIFLFLSGFGCAYSLSKVDTKTFYKRRVNRLALTIIFCGLIKYALQFTNISCFENRDITAEAIVGGDLWYFRPLVSFYILAPLLYTILIFCKTRQRVFMLSVAIFVISIVGMHLSCFGKYFSWSLSRFPSFAIGMMLAYYKPLLRNKSVLYVGLFFAVAALIYRAASLKHIINSTELGTYIILSCSLISVTHALGKCAIGGGAILNSLVGFLGSYSLELYIWHEYIFEVFFSSTYNPVIVFACSLSIAIMVSLITRRLVTQINKLII